MLGVAHRIVDDGKRMVKRQLSKNLIFEEEFQNAAYHDHTFINLVHILLVIVPPFSNAEIQ